MRIGELAEQAGISTKAIRYYERIGILAPPARTTSGYRAYDQTELGRLGFVRAAQALGHNCATSSSSSPGGPRPSTPSSARPSASVTSSLDTPLASVPRGRVSAKDW